MNHYSNEALSQVKCKSGKNQIYFQKIVDIVVSSARINYNSEMLDIDLLP